MRFSLLKLVKFILFFILFATGFITPVNKDYQFLAMFLRMKTRYFWFPATVP